MSNITKRFIELCSQQSVDDWADNRHYDTSILKQLKIGKCTIDVMNVLMKEFGKEEVEKQGFIQKGHFKFINRIIIPYNDEYFSARSLDRNTKYKNLFLKGIKKLPFFIKGEGEECHISEGETDAIALKHIYPKADIFSIGGSNSTSLLKDIKKYFKGKEVCICFDNDEAGKKALDKAKKLLVNHFRVSQLTFSEKYKDIDELFFNLDFASIKKKENFVDKIDKIMKKNKEEKSLEGGVEEGERNQTCFDLALKSKKKKVKKELTLLNLLKWNEKNNPPLNKEEVRKIVENVYNYKPKDCGFILNSDEVWEDKLFMFDKLNSNLAYYGLLLPKKKDKLDKDGNYLYSYQAKDPALVTSERTIVSVNMRLREDYNVNIWDTPSALKLRWQLESIQEWINGTAQAKTLQEIFDMIKPKYDRYVSMQDIWMDIHTLWDMATYFFPLFKVFPIFELRGLRGTAKSKTMAVSGLMTLNATDIMINPSEPTLFRETNDKRPTKYIDEAENLFKMNQGKPEPDPRIEVINSSYRYDGCVPRQERYGNKFITVYYHTYSPTMVSSINGLYGATEDRAIIRITTKPKKEDEKKGNLEPEPLDNHWQEIRNELYIAGLTYWDRIEKLYKEEDNTTGLKNRDFWLWKPLLILAKEISQELYDRVLKQALKQQETKAADFIPQDSIEHNILEIMSSTLLTSNRVYVHNIHEQLPQNQYTPKEKTISDKLDKLGLRDFRDKDRNGSFFELSRELFESIILPICPSIFSPQSSQSSQKEEIIDDNKDNNNVMNSDECDESTKKKCDECDENDECDDYFEKDDVKKRLISMLESNKLVEIQSFTDMMVGLGKASKEIDDIIELGITKGDWFEPPDKKGYLKLI